MHIWKENDRESVHYGSGSEPHSFCAPSLTLQSQLKKKTTSHLAPVTFAYYNMELVGDSKQGQRAENTWLAIVQTFAPGGYLELSLSTSLFSFEVCLRAKDLLHLPTYWDSQSTSIFSVAYFDRLWIVPSKITLWAPLDALVVLLRFVNERYYSTCEFSILGSTSQVSTVKTIQLSMKKLNSNWQTNDTASRAPQITICTDAGYDLPQFSAH